MTALLTCLMAATVCEYDAKVSLRSLNFWSSLIPGYRYIASWMISQTTPDTHDPAMYRKDLIQATLEQFFVAFIPREPDVTDCHGHPGECDR